MKICKFYQIYLFVILMSIFVLYEQCEAAIPPARKTLVTGILNAVAKPDRLTALIYGSALSVDQLVSLLDDPIVGISLKGKLDWGPDAQSKENLRKKLEAAKQPAAGAGGMTKEELEKAFAEKGLSEKFGKFLADGNLKGAFEFLFTKGQSGYQAAIAAYGDEARAKKELSNVIK